MSVPLTYLGSCVPVALSWLLDRPLDEIARRLWATGEVRWGAGIGGFRIGTALDAAGDVASRYGERVQLWNGAGELVLGADEYARYLRAVRGAGRAGDPASAVAVPGRTRADR